jgi:hypothetical protein
LWTGPFHFQPLKEHNFTFNHSISDSQSIFPVVMGTAQETMYPMGWKDHEENVLQHPEGGNRKQERN